MLDPAALVADARAATGLFDLGEDVTEPLARLVASINLESRLTPVGTGMITAGLTGVLTNRLMIEDCFRRHPEIAEVEIADPVFIIGLPRTGSTVLGQLMSLDPATRYLRAWEVARPCPPPERDAPGVDPRIAQTEAGIAQFEALAPGILQALPHAGAQDLVEDFAVLELALRSAAQDGFCHCPSFVDWVVEEADMQPAYRYHHRVLQLLQWRWPARRWVLRTPVHSYSLDALLRTYPTARFVWTHRDPLKVLPSVASLMHMIRSVTLSDPVPHELGRQLLRHWPIAMERSMRVRDEIGEERFLDVSHAEHAHDPASAAREVYAWLGWDLLPEHETAMRAWRARNPAGVHHPRAEDFDLDLEAVAERFGGYTARFAPLL